MKALPILLVLLMLWSAIWRPGPGDYVARELELELPTAQSPPGTATGASTGTACSTRS